MQSRPRLISGVVLWCRRPGGPPSTVRVLSEVCPQARGHAGRIGREARIPRALGQRTARRADFLPSPSAPAADVRAR